MEGYSVTEAASVLGVPTERVWELLARGVLSGHPEGESGMRVFLQPRPAATPSRMDMPPPEPPPPREPERELSPFRELLTEFRNLTERYGQALLALGEARGEVASLRSRVDLLEARMDLRLPMGAPVSASVGWEAPTPMPPLRRIEPEPEPEAEAELEPEPEPEPIAVEPAVLDPVDSTDMAGLTDTVDAADTAEAIDVTVVTEAASDLVESDEAGMVADAGETDEAADAEAEAEHHRRRRSHHATESFAEALARAEDPTVPELPEPHRDAMAEAAAIEAGLPRELPSAEPIPTADEEDAAIEVLPEEPDVVAAEAGPIDVEPAPEQPQLEPKPVIAETAADEHGEPDALEDEAFVAELEPEPVATEPVDAQPVAAEPPEPEPEAVRGPLVWDPERYTTDIGEPDWYAGEETPPDQPPAATSSDEEDGPAEMEVASSSGHGTEPVPDAVDEPSADPIDRLDALARSVEQPPPPAASAAWPDSRDPVAEYRASLARSSPSSGQARPLRSGPPPTTASRAYRRLRRIFPG
jgi:hypothetical protein